MDQYRITLLWFLDFAESALIAFNPLIIGKCIDDLINKKYLWLIILIACEIFYMFLVAVHKYIDTKSYSLIIEQESCQYFEREINSDKSTSTISSRLDMIDDIPDFILTGIPQTVSCVIGLIVSEIMLWYYAGLFSFIIALVVSVIIFVLTNKERQNIFRNEKKLKTIDEKREGYITNKDLKKYNSLMKKSLNLLVLNSNQDVKLFLKTYLPQISLLIAVIWISTDSGNYTVGLLFLIITYVQMLNEYVDEVNDVIISIQDLAETAVRLYGK